MLAGAMEEPPGGWTWEDYQGQAEEKSLRLFPKQQTGAPFAPTGVFLSRWMKAMDPVKAPEMTTKWEWEAPTGLQMAS